MKFVKNRTGFELTTKSYCLKYKIGNPMFVDMTFSNRVGADLFIPSGCDRDELIDEAISIDGYRIEESEKKITIFFSGITTLWDSAEYVFECFEQRVLYLYRVTGKGNLDNARFFQGFLRENPKLKGKGKPYFCGPGRHISYHRPVSFFKTGSRPKFEMGYTSLVTSADNRFFMYYEDTHIRVNATRHFQGGDWIITPPPFLFLLGHRQKDTWVSLGLVCKPGEYNFTEYQYKGGEVWGLNLQYDGYTHIDGQWESPRILFEQYEDIYGGTQQYVDYLYDIGYAPKKDRSNVPRWWKEPIFGGWGEQAFQGGHGLDYWQCESTGFSGDSPNKCTQANYEDMIRRLEAHDIDPTIIIVDYRWHEQGNQLKVDEKMWPDMKGFIRNQHQKGRKVILWISPFYYCNDENGDHIPLKEQMTLNEKEHYDLVIDTDVFYPALNLEKRKVPKKHEYLYEEKPPRIAIDPLNKDYRKRVEKAVFNLFSPEGLDADGFEFDYTNLLPATRGMHPVTERKEVCWGVEYLRETIAIYYHAAKKAKSDALIITHTFNPYFNDVVDMLRLQDFYTDNASVVDQMHHRAKTAHIVCPGCQVHTDQHPMPDLAAWREYAAFQPKIGNPCLYYVSGMETTHELLEDKDFVMLKEIWDKYRLELDKEYGLCTDIVCLDENIEDDAYI